MVNMSLFQRHRRVKRHTAFKCLKSHALVCIIVATLDVLPRQVQPKHGTRTGLDDIMLFRLREFRVRRL